MTMIRRVSITSISRFVIGYMVLAFGWWSYHLWQQNDRLYAAELSVLEHSAIPKNGVTSEVLAQKWQSTRRMIVGEGLFFTLCLAVGLYIINRSANREVSLARQRRNFMLSITHELKSPIAGMHLVLETLGKRTLSREQTEKLCANGLRDAVRLQTLVQDLLLAARLEDGWQPHPENVDLALLAQDIITSLETRFPAAHFEIKLAKDLPPLSADKAGLASVLQNLLENAAKYSGETPRVMLSARQEPNKMVLAISDNGIGIPDSEKKAVFEKFYRIGNEDTRRNTGTGLGLYIVKQVVKAHKGQISVQDNTPKGSIFVIEWPLLATMQSNADA